MKQIGILGYGEVGKAIAKVYEQFPNEYKLFIRDFDRDDFKELPELDVLNVCIPYFSKDMFEGSLGLAIEDTIPELIIIHSTVPVGTSEEFKAAHSPVRGVHPNLFEGIKTFVKYVGAADDYVGAEATKHLQELGLNVKRVKNSKTTELMKLLDTTYYGVCIEYHRFAKELCDKEDVDFEEVMTSANNTYNEGYTRLGKQNVVRPVLYPPTDMIGGHCVEQNSLLLQKQYGTNILYSMRARTSYATS